MMADGVEPESWRRVFHARQYLTALASEVDAYRESHQNAALRREDNADSDTDRYVRLRYYFDLPQEIPCSWGFVVGDVVHNLQAALDNLIWSLAVANSGHPPPNERSLAFPAFLDADEFDRVTAKSLVALHPFAVAQVKALQPFHDSHPTLNPLYLLHHLDRLDKHRSVHVVRHQAHAFDIEISPTPDELTIERSHVSALEHDTPIATVTFRWDRYPGEVDVNPVFTFYEAIQETSKTPLLPLGAFLENVIMDVGECFLHLAPLLGSPLKG